MSGVWVNVCAAITSEIEESSARDGLSTIPSANDDICVPFCNVCGKNFEEATNFFRIFEGHFAFLWLRLSFEDVFLWPRRRKMRQKRAGLWRTFENMAFTVEYPQENHQDCLTYRFE